MRKMLFGICCLITCSVFGQNLHLDQTLYLSGDTIQGAAYFEEEQLVPYAYHLSLFGEKGDAVYNKLLWIPAVSVEFFLPLSDEWASGKYTLQLSNYQNGMITHAQQVWIINPDSPGNFNIPKDPNQIGSVIKQGTTLNVALFAQEDTTNYTVQVLEDGFGDKSRVLKPGESFAKETRSNTKVQINIRDEKFRVFGITGQMTEEKLTLAAEQKGEAMNLTLAFEESMDQVSVSVTDLSQNPGKNTFPILPSDVKPACKDLPDHSRLNVGLKTWLNGFQLTGTMTNSADGSKLEGQRLILANPEDEYDLKYTATNDQGRFGFYNLDFEGTKTLYISPSGDEIPSADIEFSAPRSILVSAFPVCPTSYAATTDDLDEMLRLRKLNRKVAKQFLQRRELPVRKPIYSPELLFDDADQTIVLSDYIEFQTMKEVIKEIIPYVFTTKKGIGVFSVDQKKSFQLKPLILVNGVPIPDEEVIMALQPSEIHSVQLLNELSTIAPYGNLALGGVISIVMNDRFKYPDALARIEVEGYSTPKAPKAANRQSGVPYFPSVLHWQSTMQLDVENKGTIRFDVPDYETRVAVEVMGLTSTGQVIRTYEVLNVSRNPK